MPRKRASVIYRYLEIFHAPCRNNCLLDRKMIATFLVVSTSSTTMQSLRKIVLCTPAVGAKMWCLYVCFFVTLRVRRTEHSRGYTLNSHCVSLCVDLHSIFTAFPEEIALSESLESSHFRRQLAAQFSRNCGRNFRKLQNSTEKIVAPLRVDS